MTTMTGIGDIGRNDPCPCGSGRKFKKCCINNPLSLFPQHISERNRRWTPEEVNQIPTEKIIEKLVMCGIPFTEGDFLKDVSECYASYDIEKRWHSRFTITAKGWDEDFPWMAADVLWRRLAPTKVSTEQLDDLMQDGYDLIEQDAQTAGCLVWLTVWEKLKPRFTKEMRTIEDAESVFRGMQSLFNWCQDLEQELRNAALDDSTFHEHLIRYCREFCAFFPDGHEIVRQMKQAISESLFLSGRVDEGEREFQSLIEQYPDNPWGFITWGDVYAQFDDEINSLADNKRAEELYRKALGLDPKVDKLIQERLRDLKKGVRVNWSKAIRFPSRIQPFCLADEVMDIIKIVP